MKSSVAGRNELMTIQRIGKTAKASNAKRHTVPTTSPKISTRVRPRRRCTGVAVTTVTVLGACACKLIDAPPTDFLP